MTGGQQRKEFPPGREILPARGKRRPVRFHGQRRRLTGMRTLRYTTAAATVLMSLMNLPIAFDDGGSDIPKPLAVLISLLGVAGIVAAVALLRRVAWAPAAVVVIGVLNLIGAVGALVADWNGAVIGLVVSAVMVGLSAASLRKAPLPSRA
jgi:hypothetical protein